MKRTSAIAILLLLFYTQIGYYGQFMFLQWQLKEAAREAWIAAQPDNAFVAIRLADINTAGKWEEEGRECWYAAHLYDVIRQKTTDGTTWCFCLDDEREEKLIRQSSEMTHANHDHPDKKTGPSFTFNIVFYEESSMKLELPPFPQSSLTDYGQEPLPSRYTEIIAPPPKSTC